MKLLFGLILLLLPVVSPAAGMGYADARHLLARAGFGPTQAEVEEFARLSREAAVARLLDGTRSEAQTPAPGWADRFSRPPRLKDLSEEEKKALRRELIEKSLELRGWWYREMLATSSPLTERMTLFWHNHFVSSQQKVKSPVLMYRQNVLLRRHALGNFGELLHAVAHDPAMVVYLDSVSNQKGKPNENFARELMELFTLGEGRYTEEDVREAARAFTGWSLDRDTGNFRFYPRRHDGGSKTVLGQTGRFDGDQVIELLLARPETAERIATKLWREFVSTTADAREVRALAARLRASNYELKPVLRVLFTSEAFYAPANRAALIKSPVELIVGTLRSFEISPANTVPAVLAARRLGQDVFAPPNVKGWPGGEAWINSNTLLARKQTLERLFRAQEMPGGDGMAASVSKGARARFGGDYRFDYEHWQLGFAGKTDIRRAMTQLVLAAAPSDEPATNTDPLSFVRGLALDPVYQLK